MHTRQAAPGDIKGLQFLDVRRTHQFTFEVIDPGVIGAGEFGEIALASRHFDTAMAAYVTKCVHLPRISAADQQWLAGDADGGVISGIGKFLKTPDTQPLFHEDSIDLMLEQLRRGIEPARQML